MSMRAPGFWSADGPRWLAWLLSPAGWIYGQATARRMRQPGWRAPVPVISVGNFTAGGAGKTPTVIAIQTLLRQAGRAPCVITRGYGGCVSGPLLVDPTLHKADMVGDEPMLLAAHGPVIIAHHRVHGAQLALKQGADCLILDDALQNPDLQKTLSIAVIDGGAGFGNGFCLPAGPLRAPVGTQLPLVSDVLLIGEDKHLVLDRLPEGLPRHRSRIVPEVPASIIGRDVFAFSGIGRPDKFIETLEQADACVVGRRDFGDHHVFSALEAQQLLADAARHGAMLVTTAKDQARLQADPALQTLVRATTVLPIRIPLPEALAATILAACAG